MYLNNISSTFLDFPDSESLAVIVFFEGCLHNCKGCHNKELQKFNKEHRISWKDVYDKIVNYCKRNNTNKVVLSGGDSFFVLYIRSHEIFKLIDKLENNGYVVCAYTGNNIEVINKLYSFDDIKPYKKASYIKCGVYDENLRDNRMGKTNDEFILASSNQAFYARINDKYEQISNGNILKFKREN